MRAALELRQTLFRAGEGGYAGYRIPTLIALPGGRVLAFCEGRRHSLGDSGEIDILLRASADGGKSFAPARAILRGGGHTLGNPTPVYVRETGRLLLWCNGNLANGDEGAILQNRAPRTTLLCHSDDGGETFSALEDWTETLKPKGWTWYAFGPCHALQTRAGRVVVPANHAEFDEAAGTSRPYRSHVILSDDGGETWRIGGMAEEGTNESCVCELGDGSLYLNMRSFRGNARRMTARSLDGGEHWSEALADEALPEPCCQGSALCVGNTLYFLNPADENDRRRLTLRSSADGGRAWETLRVLEDSRAAYSDMAECEGTLLCAFECGAETAYERIDLASVALD